MKINRIVILLLCCARIFTFNAQNANTSFQYDDSGNCVVKYKTIVLPTLRSAEAEEETEDTTTPTEIETPTIDILGESEIRIYPNPTKGQLRIEWIGEFPDVAPQAILSDMNGRYLQIMEITNSDYSLDLSAYPQAIYLLRVRTGEIYRDFKIIKQ